MLHSFYYSAAQQAFEEVTAEDSTCAIGVETRTRADISRVTDGRPTKDAPATFSASAST